MMQLFKDFKGQCFICSNAFYEVPSLDALCSPSFFFSSLANNNVAIGFCMNELFLFPLSQSLPLLHPCCRQRTSKEARENIGYYVDPKSSVTDHNLVLKVSKSSSSFKIKSLERGKQGLGFAQK